MKRIIPFVKNLTLGSKISEITGIALEHNLKLENDDSVVGDFTISGKYKINEVSINEEDFEKQIPFDITLDDKYDSSKVKIDIDDFYYEIINDEYLRIHIDVLVDNLVYKEKEEPKVEIVNEEVKEESKDDDIKDDEIIYVNKDLDAHEENLTRELKDGDIMMDNKDESLDIKDVSDNIKNEEDVKTRLDEDDKKEERKDLVNDLYDAFKTEKDDYVTYKVHIIRENETIKDIEEKYNVEQEELEKYNTLDNIVLGSKIIVPLSNEKTD